MKMNVGQLEDKIKFSSLNQFLDKTLDYSCL